MTVYLVISLPKIPCIHRICMVLANSSHTRCIYIWFWPIVYVRTFGDLPAKICIYRPFTITSEIKSLFGQKTKIFINSWRPLRTDFRSDKLIIYSGFEGENWNELQARQCEPPGPVLEASVPSWKDGCSAAGPWEAAKGEAAQGAARGRGKGKGRGWEEACGAPTRLQEEASFSHSPFRNIHTECVASV